MHAASDMRDGHASSHFADDALNCSVCRATRDPVVDVFGATICRGCLRRIDADPREKRLLLFPTRDAVYS
jgi:hypothetical protein